MGRHDPKRVTRDAERNYFVNDWLVLAPSPTADTFAEIDPRFDDYGNALDEVGISLRWMHFLFAAHVHAINVTAGLRTGPSAALDLAMARSASEAKMRESCRSNVSIPVPRVAEPVLPGMEQTCPESERGRLRCPGRSAFCAAGLDAPV